MEQIYVMKRAPSLQEFPQKDWNKTKSSAKEKVYIRPKTELRTYYMFRWPRSRYPLPIWGRGWRSWHEELLLSAPYSLVACVWCCLLLGLRLLKVKLGGSIDGEGREKKKDFFSILVVHLVSLWTVEVSLLIWVAWGLPHNGIIFLLWGIYFFFDR